MGSLSHDDSPDAWIAAPPDESGARAFSECVVRVADTLPRFEQRRQLVRCEPAKAFELGPARKVSGEILLVVAHVLARDRPDARRELAHLVDEEERGTVRKDLLDFRAPEWE